LIVRIGNTGMCTYSADSSACSCDNPFIVRTGTFGSHCVCGWERTF